MEDRDAGPAGEVDQPLVVLVDVANVVGSRPDGWWRDRAGATDRLLRSLLPLLGSAVAVPGGGGSGNRTVVSRIVAVVEGAARSVSAPDGVEVIRAVRDGDSAVVAAARDLAGSGAGLVVVTADRRLRDSLPERAATAGPRWLLDLASGPEPADELDVEQSGGPGRGHDQDGARAGDRGGARAGRASGRADGPATPDSLEARLRDLERYRSTDVGQRLVQAREIEAQAAAAGAVTAMMRARLVMADMLHRTGDATEGARLAVQVNAWAGSSGPRSLLARSHLVLSSLFEGIGDAASALDHAVRAIELLDDASPWERGNYTLRLADALALNASEDEARRRYAEAEQIFAELGDPERLLNVLNNLAVLEDELGHHDRALAAARRLAEIAGPHHNAAYADTIARAQLGAGDLAGAEEAALLGVRLLREHGDTQAVTPAELALTHAEVLLAAGRLEDAERELDRCLAICAERSLAGIRVKALAVRAALLAARGDFEQAYLTHRAFHAEAVTLRSHQQEATARTRQALFETAEARREAQRFWEQARTDPLTGLYNRRFVDEELPRYLKEVVTRGGCLVATIIDIDHFKRINDEFSHALGDHVLRELAARFAAAVRTEPGEAERRAGALADVRHPGFAARLGGEEFLVVQVVASPEVAIGRIEQVRAEAAGRSWPELAPDLRVTISAGLAVAQISDTQVTLLTRADGHLYRAKAEGRNRVVAEPATGR